MDTTSVVTETFGDLTQDVTAIWATTGFMGLLRIAAMIVIGIIVIRIVLNMVDSLLLRSKNLISLRTYVKSSAKIGLYFILILMVLGSIGVDVTSVLALLSVAGLAVSLALQNTLSNLAGGIQVLLSKPFEVGDYVDTDQGSGTVTEVGLAYSKLLTIDNKAVMIPNSLVATSKITNYSSTGTRRVDIAFTASYDSSIEEIKKATLEVIAKHPQVKNDPAEPVVFVTNYGASSIEYVLRAWVDTPDYWAVYFGIMDHLLPTFTKYGLEMTYDHVNVHIVEK